VNVVLFGATGNIGRSIATELLARGHQVTGVSRRGVLPIDGVTAVAGDASDAATVSRLVAGADAVISAVGPNHDGSESKQLLLEAAHGLIDGARAAGVHRLITVGGAGSLELASGVRLIDTPTFPEAYKANAAVAVEVLEVFRGVTDLDWTYVSPAAEIAAGPRTGAFRLGGDQLLVDSDGHSTISFDDFAIGIVDQLENPTAIRKRITLAY
jgi:putative NADH-flavin reductase